VIGARPPGHAERPFYEAGLCRRVVDERAVREALKSVDDPELPVSIVDMGLIYGIEVSEPEPAHVDVEMTFTAMGCPAMDFLKHDVREAVAAVDGVGSVSIETVWDPPWTTDRMSEEARDVLRTAGVTV
jgi:phenylacetate-CoA oxygenase PaaJ subunit